MNKNINLLDDQPQNSPTFAHTINRSAANGQYTKSQGKVEDFYTMGEKIGKGAFSVVYEAVEKGTNDRYAIKVINRKYIKQKLLDREIEIMTKIRHDNILYCKAVFETDAYIYLVLELVKGGELYDKIVDEGEYTENEAKEIVYQILSAVEYLHMHQIAHRDLKPENILCGTKGGQPGSRKELIKVADFGLSKMFDRELLLSQCGSPTYVAPEVLLAIPYDQSVDMWAVGVITYVMLTGCFPFFEEGNNYKALYQKIINVEFSFPEDPVLSDQVKDFISKLLNRDPATRPSASACKLHPWLKSVSDRINSNHTSKA